MAKKNALDQSRITGSNFVMVKIPPETLTEKL